VHAIVQLKPGENQREAEASLRAFLKDTLVNYKAPSTYEFVTDFLRDEAGKVRRAQLRAERMPKT